MPMPTPSTPPPGPGAGAEDGDEGFEPNDDVVEAAEAVAVGEEG